jgi:hypothetical protein
LHVNGESSVTKLGNPKFVETQGRVVACLNQ